MYTLLETCVDRLDIFEFLTHVQASTRNKIVDRGQKTIDVSGLTFSDKIKKDKRQIQKAEVGSQKLKDKLQQTTDSRH